MKSLQFFLDKFDAFKIFAILTFEHIIEFVFQNQLKRV